MRFKQGTRRKPIEYEKDLVKYWKEREIFEKSIETRPKNDAYVFYDGPPFITGVPHHGTLLSSIVKDAVPRYWTMKGKRVDRVWGWDCHGLPAEVFTEKKLNIRDKRDVGSKISLEDYIRTCRENMVQTGSEWEDTIERIGRWVDFRGAYKTMDKDYMESVWWAFKRLYDEGKIYEGEKVLMYCIRDATPISKAEVAMDNSYKDVTDPSVYVKFKIKGEERYLLAWTTQPWTLPANSAVAVNKGIDYAEVELDGGEHFILAKDLLEMALQDDRHQALSYKVVRVIKGSELVGKEYEPLFPVDKKLQSERAFKVWHADFVHIEEGTGIVHESPATGEEDYALAKENNIPWIMSTDENGIFLMGEWQGKNLWEANKEIARSLHKRGIVWRIQYITHSYPHCHRCGTKLMYRAHPSWFMDVSGQRERMLEQNANINWFPSHIKLGRFAKTVESAPDWNLSRDRFWATAMPVWKGKDAEGRERVKVIGSYAELKELSGVELPDYHRPWIDDVRFTIDGIEYRRVDKVLDCWFESGSMPFAQFHYPFEHVEKFEQNFPGDFISEYVGQTRAWFYYLHTVGVGIFGENSFKNVIVTGTLAGNDGRKMSKHFGNYTDPNMLMDTYSADALRFLLLGSPLLNGEDFSLVDKDVSDIARKLNMVWNMYDFFTLYADVDGWEWDGELRDPTDTLKNPLDLWIVSRLHQLIQDVDTSMQAYDLVSALNPLLPFIDDASNWYVRRSRRRFWKSGDDKDKQDAYHTLHYVLVQLAHVMAPFTPFLAEELYRNLTGGESVHLRDWPTGGHINELIIQQMADLRSGIETGLSQRATAKIKVRQPLGSVRLYMLGLPGDPQTRTHYRQIVQEELNVKKVTLEEASRLKSKPYPVRLDLTITPILLKEGLAREVIRHIQNERKKAGLQVDDRIELSLSSTDEMLRKAILEYEDTIMSETLATTMSLDQTLAHNTDLVVGDAPLTVSFQKAKSRKP